MEGGGQPRRAAAVWRQGAAAQCSCCAAEAASREITQVSRALHELSASYFQHHHAASHANSHSASAHTTALSMACALWYPASLHRYPPFHNLLAASTLRLQVCVSGHPDIFSAQCGAARRRWAQVSSDCSPCAHTLSRSPRVCAPPCSPHVSALIARLARPARLHRCGAHAVLCVSCAGV